MILLRTAGSTFRASRADGADAASPPIGALPSEILAAAIATDGREPARIGETTAAIAHHGSGG
jgi:hypothetical protein